MEKFMEKLKRHKKSVVVILILIAVRVLLFESVSLEGHLDEYPNYERYQEYVLVQVNGSQYNFGLIRPWWYGKQYYFMFQWDYRELVQQIREDVFFELDTLLENTDAAENYKVNEETMVVDIYYNDDIARGKYYADNGWKIRSLCKLWYRVVYGEAPAEYRATVNFWNTEGYPVR